MTTPSTFQVLTIGAGGVVSSADMTSMMLDVSETTEEVEVEPGVKKLDDLSDVTIIDPEDLQIVTYDGETNVFKNAFLYDGEIEDYDVIRWDAADSVFKPVPWSIFPDDKFQIVSQGDETKILQFDASLISPSETRTLTTQDKDGTVALLQKNVSETDSINIDILDYSSGEVIVCDSSQLEVVVNLGEAELGVYYDVINDTGFGYIVFETDPGVTMESLEGNDNIRIPLRYGKARLVCFKNNKWHIEGDISVPSFP